MHPDPKTSVAYFYPHLLLPCELYLNTKLIFGIATVIDENQDKCRVNSGKYGEMTCHGKAGKKVNAVTQF